MPRQSAVVPVSPSLCVCYYLIQQTGAAGSNPSAALTRRNCSHLRVISLLSEPGSLQRNSQFSLFWCVKITWKLSCLQISAPPPHLIVQFTLIHHPLWSSSFQRVNSCPLPTVKGQRGRLWLFVAEQHIPNWHTADVRNRRWNSGFRYCRPIREE